MNEPTTGATARRSAVTRMAAVATAAVIPLLATSVRAHSDKPHVPKAGPVRKEQKDWGIAGDASGLCRTMNSKIIRACGALAAAVLSGAAWASSHIVDIAWAMDGRFTHQAQIAAGKFVEVCGKLPSGQGVRWSFTTGAPVDFNIHYHVGKEAVFPAKQAQISSGRDTLNAIVAQDYCWMWTNKGNAPVSLTIDLAR